MSGCRIHTRLQTALRPRNTLGRNRKEMFLRISFQTIGCSSMVGIPCLDCTDRFPVVQHCRKVHMRILAQKGQTVSLWVTIVADRHFLTQNICWLVWFPLPPSPPHPLSLSLSLTLSLSLRFPPSCSSNPFCASTSPSSLHYHSPSRLDCYYSNPYRSPVFSQCSLFVQLLSGKLSRLFPMVTRIAFPIESIALI